MIPGHLSRRAVVGGALLAPLAAGAQPAGPGLAELARGRGITFGAAVLADLLAKDQPYEVAFAREAGILVPEYEAKFGPLQPEEGRFDFTLLDAIVQWGAGRGKPVRGHALVWHQSMPDWARAALAESPARARGVMEAHVTRVLQRYRGTIRDWDVVNEVVADPPGSDTPQASGELRDSLWLRALGPSYIETALRMARERDPTLRLTLNEYGVEEDTPAAEEKRRRLLALVRGLLRARVPLDAVGVQAHLQMDKPFRPEPFAALCRSLRAEGLTVLVTEFDIREGAQLPGGYPERDRAVAERAHAFASTAVENGIRTFLTWGLVDRYSWTVSDPDVARKDGTPNRGLPLDWEYNRKRMWDALAQAFRGEPFRAG